MLLDAAAGVPNTAIASRHQVTAVSVRKWPAQFQQQGLTDWGKVAGPPDAAVVKPSIPAETIARIVELSHDHQTWSRRRRGTHWSTRRMAEQVGVSKDTVQRVWSELGLQPHRVTTFKVSNDPHFTDKLIDIVGLYLDPPERAVVLCMDEKSQIQALDRTQATLPMTKGRAGTMTHDYKRNGTTTLFAALDVLTGRVIGQCLPRHRHQEFLAFLKTIDSEVPKGLQVHVILDNYSTHKHAEVQRWLSRHKRIDGHPVLVPRRSRHKRFHLHFTPTSSSWLNQVENWFGTLTDKNLRRGVFGSVNELIVSIEEFLEVTNDNPKPYMWTATAESILAKVARARSSLQQVVSQ